MNQTYHSDVRVDTKDSSIGPRFVEFGCDQLFNGEHNSVLSFQGNGSPIRNRFSIIKQSTQEFQRSFYYD